MHVCMSTVHKAACSVSVLWCVRKCWFETAFTKLDVEDIKEKGTLLAHFLQSWHLQDHLRMECSCPALSTMVKTVSLAVCFFSSLSIRKVWLFPQAVGCIFGCGQEDPKRERGCFLAYAQLSSLKEL